VQMPTSVALVGLLWQNVPAEVTKTWSPLAAVSVPVELSGAQPFWSNGRTTLPTSASVGLPMWVAWPVPGAEAQKAFGAHVPPTNTVKVSSKLAEKGTVLFAEAAGTMRASARNAAPRATPAERGNPMPFPAPFAPSDSKPGNPTKQPMVRGIPRLY